jgi:hypothetical protein
MENQNLMTSWNHGENKKIEKLSQFSSYRQSNRPYNIFLPQFFDKKKTIYIHHKIEFAARYLEEDSSLRAVELHQNQRLQRLRRKKSRC